MSVNRHVRMRMKTQALRSQSLCGAAPDVRACFLLIWLSASCSTMTVELQYDVTFAFIQNSNLHLNVLTHIKKAATLLFHI